MSITYDAINPVAGVAGPNSDQKKGASTFLHGGNIGHFDGGTVAGACLMPLLNKLGWRGEARHLVEALPHFVDDLDLDDVRVILSNLNYSSTARSVRLCDLKPSAMTTRFRFLMDRQNQTAPSMQEKQEGRPT